MELVKGKDGKWREKKEPYITLEIETEEDWNALKNIFERARWIPASERYPEDDVMVLIQANGKPRKNIEFHNAFVLGSHSEDEGWIIDGFPEWSDPEIVAWMTLPEPYRED